MVRTDALAEAESKILRARLSRATALNLRGLGLASVPESIGQLANLQTLELSSNQLTALPDSIPHLANLRKLYLSSNQLTALPDSISRLANLQTLNLAYNRLTVLPESIAQLANLRTLYVAANQLSTLPESIARLAKLELLNVSSNPLMILPEPVRRLAQLRDLRAWCAGLTSLPSWIGDLVFLESLRVEGNSLTDLPGSIASLRGLKRLTLGDLVDGGNPLHTLPESVAELEELRFLHLVGCQLTDLPTSLDDLEHLETLDLADNPLNPELAAAYEEGLVSVKRYLRAKAEAQVVLSEAKLILIGEGEVGKSCLLGALRDDPWKDGLPTTHGIVIKPIVVPHPETGAKLTLNGWDFGGQRVYRPTHQLFFSAPAIYLVVWKPREGPQQGLVKEWIKLVQHREPEARILVVATHGGPKERQPDIDRQELWDLFGREMVTDFFLVESKPDPQTGERKGIAELKQAIARAAGNLPEVGRSVPKRWAEAREALREAGAAYLPLPEVLSLCEDCGMSEAEAEDFVRISHRLGHLIHYAHDPILRDIVVLKPDWLATAISLVLDDEETRADHGLVSFAHLGELWNEPVRGEHRYPAKLHPVFLRLMERFDLCYRIAEPDGSRPPETSLIAQLVPDVRPSPLRGWAGEPKPGDQQQIQICRILEATSAQSAAAEGLFYQLIVRLHRYSLGRANHNDSVHWQRGLVLEDDYGARALLEHVGNDVRITVRSPYPERFLAALTYEVKWLVEYFWPGLRCEVMVPCLNPVPCPGLFDVRKLIENRQRNRPEQPCPVCNEWQSIELLLHNAPTARPSPLEELLANSAEVLGILTTVRTQLAQHQGDVLARFDGLAASNRELVTKVEAAYAGLIRTITDEAKEGPRLFSLAPVDPGFFDRPTWLSTKFRLTLWCEHARLPLPVLDGGADARGSYELTVPRDWVVGAAPFLKILAGTLSLVAPVAASATRLALDEAVYQGIERQLDLGQKALDSVLEGGGRAGEWIGESDTPDIEKKGDGVLARGAVLRQLHAWLKEQDPGFGGLVRVQNKRQEFLWVHPRFESEY